MKPGSARARGGGFAVACVVRHRRGIRSKSGRHSQNLPFRQPGEHVAPRGVDGCGDAADDGGLQQSRHVRPARARRTACNRSSRIWPPSWSWNEEGTELTFPLRQGVKWHDGKPFTAAGRQMHLGPADRQVGSEKLRINPRKSWYSNLEEVTTNGDYEVTFHLKRPQPAFLALLASGWSPIYPCHVSPRDMRSHPIGTGPFKFVEFKPNEVDQGDAETRITGSRAGPISTASSRRSSRDVSTRNLAFIAGKFDMYSPHGVTIPLLKDIKSQAPQAICEVAPTNVNRTLIINRDKPPFDNPDLRRAMALSLDRKAFIDIITEGQGDIGGDHAAAARRGLGHAAGDAEDAAGLRSRRREEPRRSPQDHGEARLRARQAARGHGVDAQHPALPRSGGDPDRPVEGDLYRRRARSRSTPRNGIPKIMRKDFTVGLNVSESGGRRPRPAVLRELRLRRGAQLHRLLQSRGRQAGRPAIDGSRPGKAQAAGVGDREEAGGGRRPAGHLLPRGGDLPAAQVKGLTIMVNSIYNGWRFEDVWLDK